MNQPLDRLLEKILIVPDDAALHVFLERLRAEAQNRPVRLAFVNAHAVNLACRDAVFLTDLLACDYVVRDGSGMRILYRWLGRAAGLNLNGTDLIPRLIDLYRGQPVSLMGTADPYLENAAQAVTRQGGRVVSKIDGFHEPAAYPEQFKAHPAALTVLAMGMPRQERIAALLAETGTPGLIVCGGAILDFMGGKVVRAPSWLRRAGLEWIYRLALEPKRLFRRYVVGNALFLLRAWRYKSRH